MDSGDDGDGEDQNHGSRRVRFAGVNDDPPTGDADPVKKTPSINENRKLLDGGGGSQKDKLRRRNSGKGSAWTSSVHVPASDIPINTKSRSMSRQPSNVLPGQTSDANIYAVPDMMSPAGGLHCAPSLLASEKTMSMRSKRLVREKNLEEEEDEEEEEEDEDDDEEGSGGGSPAHEKEDEPVRMSLMSLLAEGDDDMESGGLAYMMGDDDEDEDDDDGGGAAYHSCCVCMVKHKGAAFEPCGHSFCRLCSREMWVERGNCPLCNNYILEILDVF